MSTALQRTARIALAWAADHRPAIVARAIHTTELGPRTGEDLLLVNITGDVAGVAFRGVGDDIVRRAAAALLASGGRQTMLPLTISFEDATAAGLSCGGTAQVLLQHLADVPTALWHQVIAGRPVALATDLSDDTGTLVVGDRLDATGPLLESPEGLEIARAAARLLAEPGAPTITVTIGEREVLLEAWNPVPQLLLVGRAALTEAMTDLARLLGWRSHVQTEADAAVTAVDELGPNDIVIVLEHRPSVATPVLVRALQRDVGYVGAIGSRRTQVARATALDRAGVSPEHRARVHGPTGLDLGARTPMESAVSIAAEILAERGGRDARPLRVTDTSITP